MSFRGFAMLEFRPAQFGQLIVNSLAILGGFLIGYLLTALLANRVSRSRPPTPLNRGSRLLGGVVLAVLVGIIVFGHGVGWTLFGGGTDVNSSKNGEPQPISVPRTDLVSDAAPRIRVT